MKKPSHAQRKAALAEVDQLLRVPDFDFSTKPAPLISINKWHVWVGLGAMTPKGVAARRRIYVQMRLLIIYESAIKTSQDNPGMKITGAGFFEALHAKVAKADSDITIHMSAMDLSHVMELYNPAFKRAEINEASQGTKRISHSTRAQLREAAAQWQTIIREARRKKKHPKKKDNDENQGEEDQDDENKMEEDEKAKVDYYEGLSDHAGLRAAMRAAQLTDFYPPRLTGEADGAYVLRLQQKIRELRAKVRWLEVSIEDKDGELEEKEAEIEEKDAQIEELDTKIRKKRVKVHELRGQLEDDDEDDESQGSV